MIAVDTSALIAILLDEPQAESCIEALETETDLIISAGTVAEALIVAARLDVLAGMTDIVQRLGFEIIPLTLARAQSVAEAYERWDKGIHPAALNLGDCFSYEIAKEFSCRLLCVGCDFARTDVEGVLVETM